MNKEFRSIGDLCRHHKSKIYCRDKNWRTGVRVGNTIFWYRESPLVGYMLDGATHIDEAELEQFNLDFYLDMICREIEAL